MPTADELQTLANKDRFSSVKLIDTQLVSVTSQPISIKWDKPTILGAAILDLPKNYKFHFHYTILKKHFDFSLLYSDTDSYLYEICRNDLYNDIAKNADLRK